MNSEIKPSSFISKFYSILNTQHFQQIIKLDQQSARIVIFEKERLEAQILPHFFRHNKFSSFIRQLNLYGFKKVKSTGFLCFTHPALNNKQRFLSIVAKKKLMRNGDQDLQDDNQEQYMRQIDQQSGNIQNQYLENRPLEDPQRYSNLQGMALYQEMKVFNHINCLNYFYPPWHFTNNFINRQQPIYFWAYPQIGSRNQSLTSFSQL